MSFQVLYGFLLTSMLLALSPGPDVLFIISQSITHGRKSAFAIIMGLICGLIIHLSLFAFGVSSLIINSELAFSTIKFLGGGYLLWLSYQIMKAPLSQPVIQQDLSNTQKRSFFGFMQKGFWMNVLNPKVMMFFLALFPGFLSVNNSWSIQHQIIVLGLIFIVQAFAVFFVIANIASYFSKFILKSKLFNQVIKWVQVILFGILGVFLWCTLL